MKDTRSALQLMTIVLFVLATILVVSIPSCKDSEGPTTPGGGGTTEQSAVIDGYVYGKSGVQSPVALQGARVSLVGTFYAHDTLTDSQGYFKFTVPFATDAPQSDVVALTVRKSDFISKSDTFTIQRGSSIKNNTYTLTAIDTTTVIVVTGSGKAGSIILDTLSANKISVQGTGANVTSTVTFVVKDPTGNPVAKDSALVRFSLSGVNNSATLQPPSALTDGRGRVSTTISSGTIAGVVQVVAATDTAPGMTIRSAPVPITIASGLPDSGHFTIAVQKFNIPGLIYAGLTDVMTVYVGDRYGNPVTQRTAVYFTTTGGIVQSSAYTNPDGSSSVTLFSGEPNPPNGLATITASTLNENGNDVTNSAHVVFSGFPIVSANPDPLVVADGASALLVYSVKDVNGNPMSAGETYHVTLEGGATLLNELELSGDVNITMDDRLAGGTNYAVTVRDRNPLNLTQGGFAVVIHVSGPNGGTQYSVQGQLLPSSNPPVRVVALESVTERRITVRNTGEVDTTSLVFVLKDDQDRVIPVPNVPVDFLFSGATGSFTPGRGFTDATGHVRTTFHSGADTGTASIVAQVGEVVSRPVAITILPGPPYTMKLTAIRSDSAKVNFPGAASGNNNVLLGTVKAEMKDRYGNPVLAGSVTVDFSTNGGMFLNSSAYPDRDGVAKLDWYGGPPNPPLGNATFVVSTTGEPNRPVAQSLTVTYSGDPSISTALPANFVLPNGVDTAIVFTVGDANGNPLSQGENVQITSSGAGSIVLSGDVNVTMPDTRDRNLTRFTVRVRDTNTVVQTDRAVSFTVQASGPNGTQRMTVNGTLLRATPPPFKVIALESISATTVSVTGVGETDSSSLSYILQDSSGRQVLKSGIPVLFFVASGADGSFNPQTAMTDANGRVRTTFHSGTFSGTSTVKAQASGILSQPQEIQIQGGPPSQIYFSFKVSRPPDPAPKINFPGGFSLARPQIGVAEAQAKDRYGNFVKPRTRINLATNAGSIQAVAYTDNNGTADVDWFGGVPLPAAGNARLSAWTTGENNQTISDSVDVLYTGQAVISGGLGSGLYLNRGLDTTISFSVADSNGNPLAQGSTIQVSASGDGASSVVLSGDLNVTMPDTRDVSLTQFSFRLRDTNTVVTTTRSLVVSISVSGPNGSLTKTAADSLYGAPPAPIPSITGLSLETISATRLTVKGSNDVETSSLIYQLRDSLDNPIRKSGVQIAFLSNGVPGSFTPQTTLTDANGQAQTVFHSDTVAGIVQLYARATVQNVTSPYVKIGIVGGKPDLAHFTFVLTVPGGNGVTVNLPGAMPLSQKIGEGHVLVGDRYGNPVPAGTSVYFTTNAGIIQGKAFTNDNGFGQVDWFGGNPLPPGGVATVTAATLGVNGVNVTKTATAVFSGQAVIAGGPAANFTVTGGGTATYNYRVYDANRNPLAAGASIHVTASGPGASTILLSGDVNVTMPDTRDTNKTYFSFTVQDTSTTSTLNRDLTLAINVDGGNGTAAKSATGTLTAAGTSGGRSRLPGAIALISISNDNVQVAGTGGIETSSMIWEVRDSLGIPVDSAYRVRFSFFSGPGGGEYISPDSGLSDAQTGRINAVVHSGTVSGVLQVLATVVSPSGLTKSTPVRILVNAGLPDQAHFSIGATSLNVHGWDVIGNLDTISVLVGDRYGNPVSQNTAVYFTTRIGVVTTNTGFTDINGQAKVTLISGNPRPAGGLGYVVGKTVGLNGATVTDSVRILFSGTATIDPVVTLSPFNYVDSTTSMTVTFRVWDVNHNPVVRGTTIAVTADVGVTISVVAPASVMPDTQDPSFTTFSVVIKKGSASPGPFTGTIKVGFEGSTITRSFNASVQ